MKIIFTYFIMVTNPLLYAAKPEATRLLLVRPLIEFDFYFFPNIFWLLLRNLILVDQTRKTIQNEENCVFPFWSRIEYPALNFDLASLLTKLFNINSFFYDSFRISVTFCLQ